MSSSVPYRVGTAQPPGYRSCFDLTDGETPGPGGTWSDCADLAAEGGRRARMATVLADLPPVVRNFLLGRLATLLSRAERGELNLERANVPGSVCPMQVTGERVLELRFEEQIRTDGTTQLTRLYFSEPDVDPDVLLALHLDWKRPGSAGVQDQDLHAVEAERRLDAHYNRLP